MSKALERGYVPQWRDDGSNRCPGCGGGKWYVGTSSAECAFCSTAVPIRPPSAYPLAILGRSGGQRFTVVRRSCAT